MLLLVHLPDRAAHGLAICQRSKAIVCRLSQAGGALPPEQEPAATHSAPSPTSGARRCVSPPKKLELATTLICRTPCTSIRIMRHDYPLDVRFATWTGRCEQAPWTLISCPVSSSDMHKVNSEKEGIMPLFITQGRFTPQVIKGMLAKPKTVRRRCASFSPGRAVSS